jgi:tetratricopeptide (TPR) repeat protein
MPLEGGALSRVPLLGREREWAALRRQLDEAKSARTLRVAVLRGPGGVGRSRLVQELAQIVARDGWRADRIAFDRGELLPAHGLDRLLRGLLALGDDADPRAALEQALPQSPLSRAFLGFVLGARAEGELGGLDANARREGAFVEASALLNAQLAGRPWLCALDDVQLGDADTAAFLEWLVKSDAAPAGLLVLTVREEEGAADSPWLALIRRWIEARRAQEIAIAPLDARTIETSLRAALPGPLHPHAQAIAEHVRGDVHFAEALIATVIAAGERPRVLPRTIHELVEAEVERRGGLERLRQCALLGARFRASALCAIAGEPLEETERTLTALCEAGVLMLAAGQADRELAFRRRSLRDRLQAGIRPEERRRWLARLEPWLARALEDDRSDEARLRFGPLYAEALLARGAAIEGSLWSELVGLVLRARQRPAEAAEAFARAAEGASGVRRWVLLRQAAEELQVQGSVDRALQLVGSAGWSAAGAVPRVPEAIAARLSSGRELLDDWQRLSPDEARVALQLVRAELLSHLAKKDEASTAFSKLEDELARLSGPAAAALWLRWAKTWAWFLVEIVGNPREAQKVCDKVRARTKGVELAGDLNASAFVRTEQVVASSVGEYERAAQLADEQLRLALQRGDRREESIAHNAKGIQHMGRGELAQAGEEFRRSLAAARETGFRRREAIALHNHGLVLAEMDERPAARQAQIEYLRLSGTIGNALAKGYAPASIAVVEIADQAWESAERLLAEGRTVSEAQNWSFLLAWMRGLSGLMRLGRWLERRDSLLLRQAKLDLLACADVLEEQGLAWCEELDPGEIYAALALVQRLGGSAADAKRTLDEAEKNIAPSWVISRAWLAAARAIAERGDVEAAISWFTQRGYRRAEIFLRRAASATG